MTTADWIRLTLNLAAVILSVWAAIQTRRNAKAASQHAHQAHQMERQAWGDTARAELATMKIRNLTKNL